MTKKIRIIYLILFLVGLFSLTFLTENKLTIPTGDTSILFHSGLLMLIFGVFWIEHYFTKPSDVVINGLVTFISISTLSNPPFIELWNILQYYSIALVVFAYLIISFDKEEIGYDKKTMPKKLLYLLITTLGKSKVIFSLVFILSLVSYFKIDSLQAKILVAFWGLIFLVQNLDLDRFIEAIKSFFKKESHKIIGKITSVHNPNIVRFSIFEESVCEKNSIVIFSKNERYEKDDPVGLVIGYRSIPEILEGEAIILDSNFLEGTLDDRVYVIKLDINSPFVKAREASNQLLQKINSLIGFATSNTDISRLYFKLMKNLGLEEGHITSINIDKNKEVLYQIINAKLKDEEISKNSDRTYTSTEAEQLGIWSDSKQGFETYNWVAKENSPVFYIQKDFAINKIQKKDLLEVGYVPNSSIPVNINYKDLVLYHSAILGVTGSGKSFLAYQLIEYCSQNKIKVICLDATGDHKRFLRNAVLIKEDKGFPEFLASDKYNIAIVEFYNKNKHQIEEANRIAKSALKWCEENRGDDEIKEPTPKILLVLEEAHTLVPEFNFNPEKTLQNIVSNTAQIALQARKYGLGFMIITQRTANVTKSILNQCNTIFAFQAFDETGFDFMKNYMGAHYVSAIPNLKKRQGIIVGKASVSDRPIITRFHDQDREPSNQKIIELPSKEENTTTTEVAN